MKRNYIYTGIAALFLLGSCGHHTQGHHHEEDAHQTTTCNGHDHDGHDHNHEGHSHDHEGHSHDHEGHDHEGHAHEAEAGGHDSDEIILPPAKAQAAGVESSVIEPCTFHQVIKTSGEILSAQGDESNVIAPVSGIVTFGRNTAEGMYIDKGGTLLTLLTDRTAEGDPVQKARIAYETAQKEYERMKALLPDKIVSEKEFAQARQAYENARLSYEALAHGQSAHGQKVTSPLGGYIKSLNVKEGDYVSMGQPLATVTRNRHLFLRAYVSEKHYADLKHIHSAHFRTPYDNQTYNLEQMNGRLVSYGKAGSTDYNIPVTFEFDNRGDIVPGSFAEVYLLSSAMEQVIALPRTALTEEQGSFFVYLQVDDEGYRKQLVTLGADNGESVQILSGVKAGDRVVTRGAYQVKLAGASNVLPAHSHEH